MEKNRKRSAFALGIVLILLLGGCQNSTKDSAAGSSAEENNASSSTEAETGAETAVELSDMFTDRDYEVGYDETEAAYITLNGSSAECGSDAVQIDGSTVTVIDEGVYILSGSLTDGMIIVNAENTDKLQLVLDGVSINSSASAAIYIRQADKVFITTTADSENTLANGGEFTAIDENNIDAAVFSKDDLTFNGQGSLSLESPVGHGIVSKDDLVFTSGTYTVSSAGQALNGKESVRIAGGDYTIISGKDGIHSENEDDDSQGYIYILNGSYTITAEGDGISASNYLWIDDGSFSITAGGGSENGSKSSSDNYGKFMGGGMRGGGMKQQAAEAAAENTKTTDESTSMKGIKAGGDLTINGGTFAIDSADDGVHSNASVSVNAGSFDIASGDDGFHADETLAVKEGSSITITESYEGLEGLTIDISGGEISITATDDGINAAGGADSSGMGGRDKQFGGGGGFSSSDGSMIISGGSIDIHASGDAIDSNDTFSMTGGLVTTSGPNVGDTSILDYGSSGTISGGTFIGAGASSMAQNFSSDSTQGAIMASVGNQTAGTIITLKDADGNVLLSTEMDQDFSCVILSCPDIVQGSSYTLTAGSSETSITMDSLVYSNVEGMGGGMRGGMGGGMRGGMGGKGDRQPGNANDGEPPENTGSGEPPENMGGGEPPEDIGSGEPPENMGGGKPPEDIGNGEPPEGMGGEMRGGSSTEADR